MQVSSSLCIDSLCHHEQMEDPLQESMERSVLRCRKCRKSVIDSTCLFTVTVHFSILNVFSLNNLIVYFRRCFMVFGWEINV